MLLSSVNERLLYSFVLIHACTKRGDSRLLIVVVVFFFFLIVVHFFVVEVLAALHVFVFLFVRSETVVLRELAHDEIKLGRVTSGMRDWRRRECDLTSELKLVGEE
jgi:hypothetical protein